jgi:hypothetical protein
MRARVRNDGDKLDGTLLDPLCALDASCTAVTTANGLACARNTDAKNTPGRFETGGYALGNLSGFVERSEWSVDRASHKGVLPYEVFVQGGIAKASQRRIRREQWDVWVVFGESRGRHRPMQCMSCIMSGEVTLRAASLLRARRGDDNNSFRC